MNAIFNKIDIYEIHQRVEGAARKAAWFGSLLRLAFVVLVLATGNADAYAFIQGSTLQSDLQGIFFGPWGFVAGVAILVIAVVGFLRYGIGMGIGIVLVGILLFLIPGIVNLFMSIGKSNQ